jgi:hypothetical protein
MIDEPLTADEGLLLKFQEAKVRYDNGVLFQIEDPNLDHEYLQAKLALDNLEDPTLRALARDACGIGKRAVEAERELLHLSLRVKCLFPPASFQIH